MPEEATEAPVVEQDTPAADTEPEAPAEDTPEASEPEVDYQKRYDDLRSEFDRRNQIDAALRGQLGPEAQAEAAKAYGFEFAEDDEDSDEYVDPDERLNRLEQQIQERDQQAEAQRMEQAEQEWLDTEIGKVAKTEGRDLTKEEKDIILGYALSNRFDDGQPDVDGGHERLKAIYSEAQKRLISSKKNSPRPPSGAAGEPAIDTSTSAGRRAAIEQVAAESFAD